MSFTENDFVEVYRRYENNHFCDWIPIMDRAIGKKGYVKNIYAASSSCYIDFIGVSEEDDAGIYNLTYPMESLRFAGEEDSAPLPEEDPIEAGYVYDPVEPPTFEGSLSAATPTEGESEEPTVDVVKTLLTKAAESLDEDRAIKFSQAALNAANALALTQR